VHAHTLLTQRSNKTRILSRDGEKEEAIFILWSEMLTQVYYQIEVKRKMNILQVRLSNFKMGT